MGLFDFFSGRGGGSQPAPPEYPWDRQPSVYEHVRANLRPDGPGLLEAGRDLPDEERVAAESPVRWAAGAKDGVATHHFGGEDEDGAAELLRLVLAYLGTPTAANKAAVYESVLARGVVSLIDPFLGSRREAEGLDHARLYDLARSLAVGSPDREPAKLGLALLGLFATPEDLDVFRTLGRHDEFTLYCAVALGTTEDAEGELWDLARGVEGWGRVFAVERLSRVAERSDVRDWLLREGYKNSVMFEYLAHVCATGGGLLEALSRVEIDAGLFAAAGEILRALFAGGPAAGIDDYDDAAAVVAHYLCHAETRAGSAGDFLTVAAVRDFLDDEAADWDLRAGRGWTPGPREELRSRCREFLDRPETPEPSP